MVLPIAGVLVLLLLFVFPAFAAPKAPGGATAACATCHDAGEESPAPRLDGLSRSYLTRQIQAFITGGRGASATKNVCAVERLRPLRPVELLEIVNTYASRNPAPMADGEADAELLARGEALFSEGRPSAGVQACSRCHGRDATGGTQRGLESAVVAPRLAGQKAHYLYDQLRSFRKGLRKNDYNGIMQRMVLDLTDDDYRAVSAWLSALDPATVPPAAPVSSTAVPLPDKAPLCQSCHGVNGESMHETFPKIGGLTAGHITKQLQDIRAGRRAVDVMTPIASALTDAEITEIGAYFAQFEMHRGPYDALKAARGEKIFHNGNLVTGYPACMYCHGVDGRGVAKVDWAPGDIPQLAGQHPGYLQKALRDFRSGARSNDYGALMRAIATRMTDQEIEDVSHYLYSLGEKQGGS